GTRTFGRGGVGAGREPRRAGAVRRHGALVAGVPAPGGRAVRRGRVRRRRGGAGRPVGAGGGPDGAGVSWVVSGTPTTVSAAGEIVRRFDEIQYALDEGPCLEAYRTQNAVLVENLAGEARWPRFTAAALGHGLSGVVATP